MTTQGTFSTPGQSSAFFNFEAEILWGGSTDHLPLLYKSIVIDGSSRDVGNANEAILRPGTLLGKVTATGKYVPLDPSANDGSQTLAGALPFELLMTNVVSGTDVDKLVPIFVMAPLVATELLVGGVSLVGSPDEAAIRNQINARHRFFLDDEF